MNEEIQSGGSKPGHPFRGNQYVSLGSVVETPNGKGTVVANDPDGAWVSVQGRVRKYKSADIKKVKKWDSFSLLQSEENKRRIARNAGLQTKLLELNAIKDDAVFSKELLALVSQ